MVTYANISPKMVNPREKTGKRRRKRAATTTKQEKEAPVPALVHGPTSDPGSTWGPRRLAWEGCWTGSTWGASPGTGVVSPAAWVVSLGSGVASAVWAGCLASCWWGPGMGAGGRGGGTGVGTTGSWAPRAGTYPGRQEVMKDLKAADLRM